MSMRDVLIRLIGARDLGCPNDADVLAYAENRLSSSNRVQIERHFANCHDCLEVLAFIGGETSETPAPPTEEAVSEQTNRVLAYIKNDEHGRSKPAHQVRPAAGFYISYPRLATVGLVISAIAIGSIFMLTRGQSPADAGMQALKLAVKNERYTEARLAGGFEYSRYVGPIRGDNNSTGDFHFDRAEGKVRAAAQEPSNVEARLVLARSYLARGTPGAATQALAILDQLSKSGVETPEALNDLGVARLQLVSYDDAIVLFTRALAKSPRYDEALFNRAIAYRHLRRYDEARQDLQQFISQSPDENWKNEARSRLDGLSGSSDR